MKSWKKMGVKFARDVSQIPECVAGWCLSLDPHFEEELGESCLIFCAAHKRKVSSCSSCDLSQPCASSAPSVSGYRHVYLEGIEEASIFVHVAINDICGKVSVQHPQSSCQDLVSHQGNSVGEGPGWHFSSLWVKFISGLVREAWDLSEYSWR